MKLSLKTAVFTRRLGENTVAWTISRQGHQYGVWDRRGYQYVVWDGRINQYVVVNLHREFRYGSQRPTKDSSQSCHQNSNIFLLRLIDGIKQTRKLSSLSSCLFD